MNVSRQILIIGALVATGPIVSLMACEGEPPVMSPENPPGTPPAVASASAAGSEEQNAALPPATACPPPPCAPVASSAVTSAAVPATSGATAEGSAAAGLPVPPASIPRGNILGTVTTKPASSQGQTVVFLEDGPTEDQPSHLQTVTISNRQMNFIPFVSVIGVGGKVVFANEDPFPHNVFSPDNEKFNMGNLPQNGAHYRIFKNPGAYSLLCNLHPGMLGYLLVTPSSWYARTDAKGNFVMKHVPTGTYKATAWAPRQAPVTQSVTVGEGDVTTHFDLHR